MYKTVLRPILFAFDSELIHDVAMGCIQIATAAKIPSLLSSLVPPITDPRLSVRIGSLTLPNPIGLAAGFDKQAVAFEFFAALGFGAVEVGTITSEMQPGNSRPRIFRFPDDEALINRMGFPSIGGDLALPRLQKIAWKNRQIAGPRAALGINIGKAKSVPLEKAASNYTEMLAKVVPFADYIVINISSPNTPELRKLQEPARLAEIFSLMAEIRGGVPLFVKLSPDLLPHELKEVIEVCLQAKVDGIIATNTTISRDALRTPTSEGGGLSGRPLMHTSLAMVKSISNLTEKVIPIIGVGGIFTAADVLDYMRAGASAVQIYTGLVYEGPFVCHTILKELVLKLDQQGASSVSQLIH